MTGYWQKLQDSLSIIGPFRWLAALVLATMVLNALFGALGVGVVLPVFDFLNRGAAAGQGSAKYLMPVLGLFPPQHHLLILCLGVILLFALKNMVGLLSVWLSSRFAFRLRDYWADGISRRYLFERYDLFIHHQQGIVINNLLREPADAAMALGFVLESLSALILAGSIFVLTCLVSWRFVLAFSAVCGLLVLLLRRVTYGYSVQMGAKRLKLYHRLSAQIAETVAAMKEVKITCSEGLRHQEMLGILERIGRIKVHVAVVNAAPQAVGEFAVISLFMVAIFVVTAVMGVGFQAILPQLAFFFLAFTRLFLTVSNLFAMRMRALNLWPSLELVHRLTQESPQPEDQGRGLPIGRLESDIVFRGVAFAYGPEQPVFSGLDMVIPRGRVTFVIGPSGAGKSTLIDLLVRLYPPDRGTIMANGRDIQEFKLRDWRAIIGYVSQDVFLFNGTVRENIMIGRPQASEEEMVRAAGTAGAHEFISALPQGYDTPIGDRGLALSGGQRKRVAIARALIRNPQILIFDEATSSFEQEMEEQLLGELKAAYQDKTVIHITHRLSGAVQADQVYVIEKGTVAAAGKWEDIQPLRVAAP